MGTLKEVAALAGVSMSTVSRYLSGKLTVKPQTEAAIIRAVQEVQYQPNLLARSLRVGISRALAVIVPNTHNPLFSEYTRGMIEVFDGSGYLYFFFPSLSRMEAEVSLCQTLIQKRFDGVIFTSRPRDGDAKEPHIVNLMERGIKVVFLNRSYGSFPVSEVYNGHQFGTYAATTSLLAQGRRRIGLLLGYALPDRDSTVRFSGYHQALHERGLAVDNDLVLEGYYNFEDALARVPRLLARGIDGLVCVNDLMAAGALRAIAAHGARVPDDVAVIGYGDTVVARMVTPELSSVNQGSHFIGRRAAEVLLSLVSGAQKEIVQETVPVNLVIRASSQAAAHPL